jgi:hypothetical protein
MSPEGTLASEGDPETIEVVVHVEDASPNLDMIKVKSRLSG